jgi:hypothetical protein
MMRCELMVAAATAAHKDGTGLTGGEWRGILRDPADELGRGQNNVDKTKINCTATETPRSKVIITQGSRICF